MYQIRTYSGDYASKLNALLQHYADATPEAKILPADFYTYHPAFEGGKNIFCAFDAEENLIAFAPMLPVVVSEDIDHANPHNIWAVITVDPAVEAKTTVRDMVYQKVYERASEIKASLHDARPVRLSSDLFSTQKAEIDYFLSKGFEHYQSVYIMQRDLATSIPEVLLPNGVKVAQWKMETPEEQSKYVKAYNIAFPHAPKTLEGLQTFLASNEWSVGTSITAFDDNEEVLGSVMAFWNPRVESGSRLIGMTEDIFVIPARRGEGIAQYLVKEALKYLQSQGVAEARLEVLVDNANALNIYRKMGYEVLSHEVLLGVLI